MKANASLGPAGSDVALVLTLLGVRGWGEGGNLNSAGAGLQAELRQGQFPAQPPGVQASRTSPPSPCPPAVAPAPAFLRVATPTPKSSYRLLSVLLFFGDRDYYRGLGWGGGRDLPFYRASNTWLEVEFWPSIGRGDGYLG